LLEGWKDTMEMDFFDKAWEKRVLQIFHREELATPPKVSDETLKTYFAFLQKNLTFPMKGTYDQETGSSQKLIRPITTLKLIQDIDEFYGLFIKGVVGKKHVEIRLVDFDCKTTDHRNYQLLDDYKTWFWNNR
jgi:hypothetical protein